MKYRPLRSVGPWLAFPWLLATAAAGAAGEDLSRPGDGASTFRDVVDVQLVNVEVWVTDRKGRPVTGLTAADFEVLEDGQAVKISHFAEIEDFERKAGTDAIAPLEAPEAPGVGLSEPAAPEAVEGHLILYFDEMHMGLQGRKRLVSDLRKFLATQSVPPKRILILRQSDNLTMQAPFGSSAEEIDAALSDLAEPTGRTTQASMEKDLQLRLLKNLWEINRQVRSPCATFVPSALAGIESYAAEARGRVENTLNHLAEVSTFLAGVPGLKTLVYLSDALDLRTGADLVAFVDTICPLRDQGYTAPAFTLSTELSGALNELTRHANTNRVTVYSLQASGLRADAFFSATESAVDRRALNGAREFTRSRRLNDRDGLLTLAAETGGRAILNQNRFDDNFEEITREMRTYYSLAYAPLHGGDGMRHKIQVKVNREKTNVRHRQGYRDKSAEERMTERLQSVLYLGVGENALSARLGAGTVRAGGGDRVTLPLHVFVPAKSLVFLPNDAGDRAEVRVKVAARNYDSGKLEFEERLFEAPRPSDTEHLDFVVELDLEKSVYTIAVGLRDEASQETSYISTTVEIQDPG